jgi:hypothetical protein
MALVNESGGETGDGMSGPQLPEPRRSPSIVQVGPGRRRSPGRLLHGLLITFSLCHFLVIPAANTCCLSSKSSVSIKKLRICSLKHICFNDGQLISNFAESAAGRRDIRSESDALRATAEIPSFVARIGTDVPYHGFRVFVNLRVASFNQVAYTVGVMYTYRTLQACARQFRPSNPEP